MARKPASPNHVAGSPYLRGQPPAASLARRLAPWLGLLLALGALLVPLLGENGLAVFLRLKSQRDDMRQHVAALSAQADTLQTQLDALTTDPQTLERFARERYNLRRPGEEVLLIVPSSGRPGSP
jgi:cell division protein FtsB